MQLTRENYYSREANLEYMSVSQFKNFAGTPGKPGCEARAMAELRGKWKEKTSPALMFGSYVDAHFEGTLDVFIAQLPPGYVTKTGTIHQVKLKSCQADEVIARIERDPCFMKYLSGEKQGIFTGSMFGGMWKGRVDSLLPGRCIVDLKTTREIRKATYHKATGHITFIEEWGYDTQGAVYQKLIELTTGERLPFIIAAVSKEAEPDIEIIGFTQFDLDTALRRVEGFMPHILDVKSGEIEPTRCEKCDYCKNTKVLKAPVYFRDLID